MGNRSSRKDNVKLPVITTTTTVAAVMETRPSSHSTIAPVKPDVVAPFIEKFKLLKQQFNIVDKLPIEPATNTPSYEEFIEKVKSWLDLIFGKREITDIICIYLINFTKFKGCCGYLDDKICLVIPHDPHQYKYIISHVKMSYSTVLLYSKDTDGRVCTEMFNLNSRKRIELHKCWDRCVPCSKNHNPYHLLKSAGLLPSLDKETGRVDKEELSMKIIGHYKLNGNVFEVFELCESLMVRYLNGNSVPMPSCDGLFLTDDKVFVYFKSCEMLMVCDLLNGVILRGGISLIGINFFTNCGILNIHYQADNDSYYILFDGGHMLRHRFKFEKDCVTPLESQPIYDYNW